MSAALIAIIGSLTLLGAGAFTIERRATARINTLAKRRAELNQAREENLNRLKELREKIVAEPVEEIEEIEEFVEEAPPAKPSRSHKSRLYGRSKGQSLFKGLKPATKKPTSNLPQLLSRYRVIEDLTSHNPLHHHLRMLMQVDSALHHHRIFPQDIPSFPVVFVEPPVLEPEEQSPPLFIPVPR